MSAKIPMLINIDKDTQIDVRCQVRILYMIFPSLEQTIMISSSHMLLRQENDACY